MSDVEFCYPQSRRINVEFYLLGTCKFGPVFQTPAAVFPSFVSEVGSSCQIFQAMAVCFIEKNQLYAEDQAINIQARQRRYGEIWLLHVGSGLKSMLASGSQTLGVSYIQNA